MGIHVLDDVTINKIAAGEVIERPSSALKELLENAFDGGATKIEINFEEGGKQLLQVRDNGQGIVKEELPLALQRHATSKINSAEDLFKLTTMGFRGEALASIGSVSELIISSTTVHGSQGGRIRALGGKISEIEPCPPLPGTQIDVRNLFFNLPARQKFLKSTAGETAAIKKTAQSFALAHPEIQITLRQEGRLLFHYGVQSFFERACSVLELNSADAFELNVDEGAYHLQCVLAHPKLNIVTQKGINIFVQNRPVQDKLLTQAVIEGYKNLLLERHYPQVVLALWVPPDVVDVNVHPSKNQVKFKDPSEIFRFVSAQIKNHFAQNLEKEINPVFVSTSSFSPPLQQNFIQDESVFYQKKEWPKNPAETATPASISSPESVTSASAIQPVQELTPEKTWSALQVLAQLDRTYILAQSQKGLVIIDQHAAHERVLFERLKNQKQLEVQGALLEDLVTLDEHKLELLIGDRWLNQFQKWGFEYYQRGKNILAVSARPAFLNDTSMQVLFEKIADQIESFGGSGEVEEVINEIWASLSCHGAIRAGKVMSIEEMQTFLHQMEEQPFSSFCPHGRPVSVQLSHVELERLFKRIV